MPVTQTQIANMALVSISQEPISDFNGSDRNSTIIRIFYDTTLKGVLEKFPWSFANKRAVLSPDVSAPAFSYAYQFTLPGDFVKTREVLDNDLNRIDYEIEGGKLLTHTNEIYLKYTSLVTDTGVYTGEFSKALALQLAADIAYTVTKSVNTSDAAIKIANAYWLEATFNEDLGSTNLDRQDDSRWVAGSGWLSDG